MNSATPTPAKVLSKGQMKRAVRQNQVRTRKVLFNPFAIEWPVVSRTDTAAILTAITDSLQRFQPAPSLSNSDYKRLLDAGDRAAIAEARQKQRESVQGRQEHLSDCVLGFNAASRALEDSSLAALLVEADTPALETKMLAPLAAGRRCPAVCVHRLSPTLRDHIGIPASVFGLKLAAREKSHHLHPLYLAVCATAPALRTDTPEPTHQPVPLELQPDSVLRDTTPMEESVSPEEPPERNGSPAPFGEEDFISLSTPVALPKRLPKRAEVRRQMESLMCIDTVGVPHKQRPLLKAVQVMKVSLGNKAEKKAAKLARKKAAKMARKDATNSEAKTKDSE